jgi:hypothetical protein
MTRLIRKGTDSSNFDYYSDIINCTTNSFDEGWANYDQLVLETCHVAKFLSQLDEGIEMVQKFEKPDFIIRNQNRKIGLEHETLVHTDSKIKEGSFGDLVNELQKEYSKRHPDQKLMLTIYPQPYLAFRKVDKPGILEKMIQLIENYIKSNQLPENDYLDRLFLMPHSRLSFNCNLGGWWQRYLDINSLNEAIIKKEKKVNEYRLNSGIKEQWLLIVVGGVGESSYVVDSIESIQGCFKAKFDKVFLLEDFQANLYEIE